MSGTHACLVQRGNKGRRAAWVAAWLGLAASPAWAADLQVSPVLVEFQPQQQAQALYLTNSGKEPLQAQVRVQRWTQHDGQEQLSASEDVVASPTIVRIEPGQRQTVRVVRQKPTAPATEQAYRLLVDELPKTQAPERTGLRLLLRYSIPMFVAPLDGDAAHAGSAVKPPVLADLSQVHAQLRPGGERKSQLQVGNDGKRHLRISYLSVDGAGGASRALGDGLLGYVLPGQRMAWPVDLPYPLPADQTLKARFNDDRETRPLPMDRAGR